LEDRARRPARLRITAPIFHESRAAKIGMIAAYR
jgi:hypothetical protein